VQDDAVAVAEALARAAIVEQLSPAGLAAFGACPHPCALLRDAARLGGGQGMRAVVHPSRLAGPRPSRGPNGEGLQGGERVPDGREQQTDRPRYHQL
jgi:hypothetical protein